MIVNRLAFVGLALLALGQCPDKHHSRSRLQTEEAMSRTHRHLVGHDCIGEGCPHPSHYGAIPAGPDEDLEYAGLPVATVPRNGPIYPMSALIAGQVSRAVSLGQNQTDLIMEIRGKDDESMIFTVEIGLGATLIQPGVSGAPASVLSLLGGAGPAFSAFFSIEWGNGGSQKGIILDAVPGQTVTLSGSFLRVYATSGFPGPVVFNASVSLLPHPTVRKPRYTEAFNALAAAASVVFNVFPYDDTIHVLRTPVNTVTIDLLDTAGAVRATFQYAAGVQADPIKLPSVRGVQVRITNTGAVAIDGEVMHELAL